MDIRNVNDFRKAMRHGPYAWPGGYPVYFVTADGGTLSFAAVRAERGHVLHAIASGNKWSAWCVIAMDINWEDPNLMCDHTGARIESAYAEPEPA